MASNQTSGIQGSGVSSEEKSASRANSHCVVYRTGGTENFQWHRSLAMSYDEATNARDDAERMGYAAHVENYQRSVSIGLPETYA